MLVLPRYALSVKLVCLFRSKRIFWVCGAVAALSLVCIISLVSRAGGQTPGPLLIAARTPSAAEPASQVSGEALQSCAAALAEAQRVLDATATMQAVMEKRERVKGRLEPMQQIELKVRRSPRSVYMRWRSPDEGQEVLWQENAHGNRILVHPGGWRGRLMPMVKVDPKSPRVTEQSRRPIESAGLWALTKHIDALVAKARQADIGLQVEAASNQPFAGRSCTRYRLVRTSESAVGDFQSIAIYIDPAVKVPVGFERYVPAGSSRAEPVLDEYYAYRELRLNVALADRDFDTANPAYHFSDAAEAGQQPESIGSKAGAQLK